MAVAFTQVGTPVVTQWVSTELHRPDVVMGQPSPMGSGQYGGTGWTIVDLKEDSAFTLLTVSTTSWTIITDTSKGTITTWAAA